MIGISAVYDGTQLNFTSTSCLLASRMGPIIILKCDLQECSCSRLDYVTIIVLENRHRFEIKSLPVVFSPIFINDTCNKARILSHIAVIRNLEPRLPHSP